MMTIPLRDQLSDLLRAGLLAAQRANAVAAFTIPDVLPVEPSRFETHGDYGSPVCLGLAKTLKRAPVQIAQDIIPHIPPAPFVRKVEVAAPGYINFTLDESWLAQQVHDF